MESMNEEYVCDEILFEGEYELCESFSVADCLYDFAKI